VSTSEIDSSRAYHGWFQLSPRPPDAQSVLQDKVDLGTMRLSVSYSQDRIFPFEMYRPLQTLLLQTLEVLVRRQEWLRVQFGMLHLCLLRMKVHLYFIRNAHA
jgi:hypothetical protein